MGKPDFCMCAPGQPRVSSLSLLALQQLPLPPPTVTIWGGIEFVPNSFCLDSIGRG